MKKTAPFKLSSTSIGIVAVALAITTWLFWASANKKTDNTVHLSLVGVWQDSDVMGSGWSNRYHFYADGNFSFVTSTMDCSSRLRQIDGTWTMENGQLILNKEQVLTFEEGKLEPAIGSCGTPYELVDYTTKITPYKESYSSDTEQYSVALTTYKDDEIGQDRLKTDFGNNHYYKFYNDPTVDAPNRLE